MAVVGGPCGKEGRARARLRLAYCLLLYRLSRSFPFRKGRAGPGTAQRHHCQKGRLPPRFLHFLCFARGAGSAPGLSSTPSSLYKGRQEAAADASLSEHTRRVVPGLCDIRSRLAADNMCGQTLCRHACDERREDRRLLPPPFPPPSPLPPLPPSSLPPFFASLAFLLISRPLPLLSLPPSTYR